MILDKLFAGYQPAIPKVHCSLQNTQLDNLETTEGAELSRSRSCNGGSFVTHNFYWNHYTGFQYLSELTSNWQLWLARYSLLHNLNTFISWSPVNSLVNRWHCAHQLVLYSKHHAPELHTAAALLVQPYQLSGPSVPDSCSNFNIQAVPTSVIEANSLPAFCRWLKTHLFTVAFENNG